MLLFGKYRTTKMIQVFGIFFQNIKMNSIVEVKYSAANNSIHAKEPKKATAGSTGYDLFAAEDKTLFPSCVTPVAIEVEMEIPSGYFGKIYPKSSFVRKYFVSCDAGIIDSDFRGTVLILITNNSMEPLVIKAGQRIAQIVFHKKEAVVFKKVDCLRSTETRFGGLGLTDI